MNATSELEILLGTRKGTASRNRRRSTKRKKFAVAGTIFLAGFILGIVIGRFPPPAQRKSETEVRLACALQAFQNYSVELDPMEFTFPSQDEDVPVILDLIEFAIPNLDSGDHEAEPNAFGPDRKGGHTMAHANEKRESLLGESGTDGGTVPAKNRDQGLKRWRNIGAAIEGRLDYAIAEIHRTNNPLSHDFREIQNFADLKREAGKSANLAKNLTGDLAEVRNNAIQMYTDQLHSILGDISTSAFAGSWETSFGKMHLKVVGSTITGHYEYEGGQISGTLSKDGKSISGKWKQSTNQAAGTFLFVLGGDNVSWSGQWGVDDRPKTATDWHGWRPGLKKES